MLAFDQVANSLDTTNNVINAVRVSVAACPNLQCQNGGQFSPDCSSCINCNPGFHGTVSGLVLGLNRMLTLGCRQLCDVALACDPAQGNACRGDFSSTCVCECEYGWMGTSCDGTMPCQSMMTNA